MKSALLNEERLERGVDRALIRALDIESSIASHEFDLAAMKCEDLRRQLLRLNTFANALADKEDV